MSRCACVSVFDARPRLMSAYYLYGRSVRPPARTMEQPRVSVVRVRKSYILARAPQYSRARTIECACVVNRRLCAATRAKLIVAVRACVCVFVALLSSRPNRKHTHTPRKKLCHVFVSRRPSAMTCCVGGAVLLI